MDGRYRPTRLHPAHKRRWRCATGNNAVMGKNSKRRRDAKRANKARATPSSARVGVSGEARPTGMNPDEMVRRLVLAGVFALQGIDQDARALEVVVDTLVDLDGSEGPGVHRPERALSRQLIDMAATLWEDGWEPVDLVHVLRRHGTVRLTRLGSAVVAAEAVTSGAFAKAPPRWLAQLDALNAGVAAAADDDDGLALLIRWRASEKVGVADSIEHGLRLLAQLEMLRPLAPLDDPPSAWGRPDSQFRRVVRATSGSEPKLLVMIRALLAKAESTTFPAEAEAFTAKAQDLMSRHAIDAAVLAAKGERNLTGEVQPRRVHIDNPYGKEKAQLLGVVAHVNNVRVVWDDQVGMATIIGFPFDLELVEMLTTSLLIQATQAMTDVSNTSTHNRSPSFRRAFLLSYGSRIGHRLERAGQQARDGAAADYGTALVPILVERREAVATVTERLFPETRPMRGRTVDGRGWAAGRVAADLADLAAARSALR